MMVKSIVAAVAAFASLAAFAERDTAIYRGKLTSDLDANGNAITNVAPPSAPGDAVNKAYVDAISRLTPQDATNAAVAVVAPVAKAATNYTDAAVASATNAIQLCDGAARPLPRYLHALSYDATYPEDVAALRGLLGGRFGCSARRSGNTFERNYDLHLDETAEFVVRMSAVGSRFASLGVANVGTNLTEQFVTSGKPSRWYKVLPSIMLDGINENGVVCEVNVTDGEWGRTSGELHCLEAVRWALDNGTSAGMVASNLAAKVYIPQGFGNFHWMVADENETWIVENREAIRVTDAVAVMTNYNIGSAGGEGHERYASLVGGAAITSQWWTAAYDRTTRPIRVSDIGANYEAVWTAWESATKEEHRAQGGWWQTLHTSVYDITNRVLRVAVQETDDWYTFALPSGGGKVKSVNGKVGDVELTAADVGAAAASELTAHTSNRSNPHSVTAAQVGAYSKTESDRKLDGKVTGTFTGIHGALPDGTDYYIWGSSDGTNAEAMFTDASGVSRNVPLTPFPIIIQEGGATILGITRSGPNELLVANESGFNRHALSSIVGALGFRTAVETVISESDAKVPTSKAVKSALASKRGFNDYSIWRKATAYPAITSVGAYVAEDEDGYYVLFKRDGSAAVNFYYADADGNLTISSLSQILQPDIFYPQVTEIPQGGLIIFVHDTIAMRSEIPALVAPSTAASASGKAADAKATGDALAGKVDSEGDGGAAGYASIGYSEDGLSPMLTSDVGTGTVFYDRLTYKKSILVPDDSNVMTSNMVLSIVSPADPTFSNAVLGVVNTNDLLCLTEDEASNKTAVTVGSRLNAETADPWKETDMYVRGMVVSKDGRVYECVAPSGYVFPGTWESQAGNWADFSFETSVGEYSLTIGKTVSAGYCSTASGESTMADGSFSHAEGVGSRSKGNASHAEGDHTKANGFAAHAEGDSTVASGQASHAEGAATKAEAIYTHADGVRAVATNRTSFVWQGTDSGSETEGVDLSSVTPYGSHGPGTFNIKPAGGIDGVYVGDRPIREQVGIRYATNEVRTADYWIDGKPIYTKVVFIDRPPSTTARLIDIGLSPGDEIVEARALIIGTDEQNENFQLPYCWADGNVTDLKFYGAFFTTRGSSTKPPYANLQFGSGLYGFTSRIRIILRYTKGVDTKDEN